MASIGSGETEEAILVELKRERLISEHEDQLQCYLDHAAESELLRAFLDRGAPLRGVLATVTARSYRPRSADISISVVNREKTIHVLKRLRRQRLD